MFPEQNQNQNSEEDFDVAKNMPAIFAGIGCAILLLPVVIALLAFAWMLLCM